MIIGLVQLSDIHFRDTKNWISDKAQKIAGAVRSVDPSVANYLLLFSGDLAFSGKTEEYAEVSHFIAQLKTSFADLNRTPTVNIALIPGNHDCDFTSDTDGRQLAVENVWSRLSAFDLSGTIAGQCLSVQDPFYQFATVQIGLPFITQSERFLAFAEYDFGGFRVWLNLINSAWMSTKNEKQGQLLYPVDRIESSLKKSTNADFVITMLHHPNNWFATENARQLRDTLERYSDVVMTGHEHESSIYSKDGLAQSLLYMEGAVLQDNDHHKSGFASLHINTDTREQKLTQFEWTSGLYSHIYEGEWEPIRRNTSLVKNRLDNTFNFTTFLRDLGVGFTHPHITAPLSLEQLFIYPDLMRRSMIRKGNASTVDGKAILDTLRNDKKALISGSALSGKSTLAKALYKDFKIRHDLAPILLQGQALRSVNPSELKRILDDALRQQYGSNAVESYHQLPSSQKLLLIDDFDRCGFNTKGQQILIETFNASFDYITLFVDEFSILTSIGSHEENAALVDFELYEIREFGFFLRGKLIEKWVSLGREHLLSKAAFNSEVESYERTVTALLGRNLLPSNPITILTVLQASEATKTHDPTAGSYGYLYETLILHALSAGFKPPEIDVTMTFLSNVAYQMLSADQESLDQQDIKSLEDGYFEEYRVRLPTDLLSRLGIARLMDHRDGRYAFRYPYCFYFFAARYLRDHNQFASSPHIKQLIGEMADHVHYDRYANILTFYVYLSKDVEAIKFLIDNARQVYAEFEPCDFVNDVNFINRLYKGKLPPKSIPRTSVQENRDSYRRDLDEGKDSPEAPAVVELDGPGNKIKYQPDLSMAVKMNIASKYLQILGQIIRNSPGSLKATIKREVAAEAYLLGLRIVNALLQLPQTNYDGIHEYFSELIREYRVIHRKPMLLKSEISKLADESIIKFSEALGFSLIRRISQAIGLKELNDIYSEVLAAHGNKIAMRLIDLSIKLDHFENSPEEEAKRLEKELRENYYSHNVLRDLIVSYLYLREIDHAKRNRLLGMFKIQIDQRKLLSNPDRRKML